MLYGCTHMATVGVKRLRQKPELIILVLSAAACSSIGSVVGFAEMPQNLLSKIS